MKVIASVFTLVNTNLSQAINKLIEFGMPLLIMRLSDQAWVTYKKHWEAVSES